jgi:PD-(D/E)XK nuclease superfamily
MTPAITISNSKAKTFRRCPKQFNYKYNQRLVPRRRGRAPELGTWVHELLMTHYDGEDWREAHARRTKEFNNLFEEERESFGDMPGDAARLMRSYLRTYPNDLKEYRVVDTELDERVDTFRFIIDLIVEHIPTGHLWLKDYKTLGRFLPDDFMLLDSQLARYFWAAKQIGIETPDTPLMGVIFDEILTKAPTVPALLQSGRLTQKKNQNTDVTTYVWAMKNLDKTDESWNDKVKFYYTTLQRIKAQQVGRFFRRTYLPRDRPMTQRVMRELMMTTGDIKRANRRNEFPRNVSKECVWSCDYLDLCQIELQGGDASATKKLKFTVKEKEADVEDKNKRHSG